MARFSNPLNGVRVASPCSADWNEMYGTESKRFCGKCGMNVYNMSAMTRDEAESLIMNSEGRLCARFYRRKDGTILTKDCPVGWRAAKARLGRFWSAAASLVIALFAGIGFASLLGRGEPQGVTGVIRINEPFESVMGNVAIDDPHTMGEIAMPDTNVKMGRVAVEDRN